MPHGIFWTLSSTVAPGSSPCFLSYSLQSLLSLPTRVIISNCIYDYLDPMAAPTLLPALDAPQSSNDENKSLTRCAGSCPPLSPGCSQVLLRVPSTEAFSYADPLDHLFPPGHTPNFIFLGRPTVLGQGNFPHCKLSEPHDLNCPALGEVDVGPALAGRDHIDIGAHVCHK